MPLEKICSEICRNVEGYAAERYIRDCLDEKYKEVKKRHKQTEKDEEAPPHQIEIDTSGRNRRIQS